MIAIIPEQDSNIVSIPVKECFHKQDYEYFVPRIEELIRERGQIRILFDMQDFQGWNKGVLWFGIRHFPEIERVAFVGDKKWEKGVGILGKPFIKAKLRYFDQNQTERAAIWLREG